MKDKDFENVPCPKCKTPMFGGWLEAPIYRSEEEGFIEMYVGYCPTCENVETKTLAGTQVY